MNFNKVDSIDIESNYYQPGTDDFIPKYHVEYIENREKRTKNKNGLSMVIYFQAFGPKSETEEGEKCARFEIKNKDIFVTIDDEIDYSPLTILNSKYTGLIECKIDDIDSGNQKFMYRFSFEETQSEQDNTKKSDMSYTNEPMGAKDFRNKFNEITKKIITRDISVMDEDGEPRVKIKYLSGRTGQIELYDSVPDADFEYIQCVHKCTSSELKNNWTTASCGIPFNFAYVFDRVINGKIYTLILRRSPTDNHVSDVFSESILESIFDMHTEMLSDERHDDLIERLERIERKVIENQTSKKISASRIKQF